MRGAANAVACFAVLLIGVRTGVSNAPHAPELDAYMRCPSVAGADLTQTTALMGSRPTRTVETSKGKRQIHLVDGVRLAYASPGSDTFASLKVEALDRANYAQGRTDLIRNFDFLFALEEIAERDTTPPQVDGFDIRGFNNKDMLGDVIGVYLVLDDGNRVETTVSFLNADPAKHAHGGPAEYAQLRSRFLVSYLSCVRENMNNTVKPVK